MATLISAIIIGGIAGWLASLVTGTSERMGCLLNILVGVVGAIIGNWVFRSLGWHIPGGDWVGPIIVAFVGATIFLGVLRLLTGSR